MGAGRWPADPQDRLWPRIVVESPGCWLWTGSLRNGYGNLRWDGRTTYLHRLVFELLVGPIPAGTELDHLCRQTACCNPDHLEPVTHATNVARGAAAAQIGARSRAVTHCAKGHPFTGRNVFTSGGQRRCRTCCVEGNRRRRAAA